MTTPLCRTFQMLAQQTWSDLEDASRYGLSVGETSITDYRLLDIKRAHPADVRVWKINQRQEAKWGADWAWWFRGNHSSYGMLVQAKVLDASSLKYLHLPHKARYSEKLQADVLIESAAKHKYNRTKYPLQPVYCFYNYLPAEKDDPQWSCQSFVPHRYWWGCSVADARLVRKRIKDKQIDLATIGSVSFPWSCLVCCRAGGGDEAPLPERVRGFGSLMAAADFPPPGITDGVPQYINQLIQADSQQTAVEEILRTIQVAGVVLIK